MLLRDIFDNDPALRSKLITASLGGMATAFAENGLYEGGQWENIPLCTVINQCECIHTWRSFKESQQLPTLSNTLPVFNSVLADSGLVYRVVNPANDWFIQDALYYNATSSPLRFYIAPDDIYNFGGNVNFIAFDSLFTARFKRTSNTEVALAIDYTSNPNDQRPNDLLSIENTAGFQTLGFHTKDYHIYLWALIEQIDEKINSCSKTTATETLLDTKNHLIVYPNPSNGSFAIEIDAPIPDEEYLLITDVYGRIVKKINPEQINQVKLENSGVYLLISKYGTRKLIVKQPEPIVRGYSDGEHKTTMTAKTIEEFKALQYRYDLLLAWKDSEKPEDIKAIQEFLDEFGFWAYSTD